jgi:hypothetical protein
MLCQLFAENTTQRSGSERGFVNAQMCAQRLIEQSLIPLSCFLGKSFEALDDNIVQVNRNACLALRGEPAPRLALEKSYTFFIVPDFLRFGFAHRNDSSLVAAQRVNHHAETSKHVHSN